MLALNRKDFDSKIFKYNISSTSSLVYIGFPYFGLHKLSGKRGQLIISAKK